MIEHDFGDNRNDVGTEKSNRALRASHETGNKAIPGYTNIDVDWYVSMKSMLRKVL